MQSAGIEIPVVVWDHCPEPINGRNNIPIGNCVRGSFLIRTSKQKGVPEISSRHAFFSVLIKEPNRIYRKSDRTDCELWLAIPNTLVPDWIRI